MVVVAVVVRLTWIPQVKVCTAALTQGISLAGLTRYLLLRPYSRLAPSCLLLAYLLVLSPQPRDHVSLIHASPKYLATLRLPILGTRIPSKKLCSATLATVLTCALARHEDAVEPIENG